MSIRAIGWLLLFAGAVGIIISAAIGSDWPMYGCLIISTSGAILVTYDKRRKKVS